MHHPGRALKIESFGRNIGDNEMLRRVGQVCRLAEPGQHALSWCSSRANSS
jgi:hypothetical protein